MPGNSKWEICIVHFGVLDILCSFNNVGLCSAAEKVLQNSLRLLSYIDMNQPWIHMYSSN